VQWGESLHSRARVDSSKGVPARRLRLQKSANDVEASTSALPQATGRVDGGPCSRDPARGRTGSKTSTTSAAVAKPRRWEGRSRALERAPPGEDLCSMEGISGRHSARLVHASVSAAASAALEESRERASGTGPAGEATGMSEARSARIATGRQRPPWWNTTGIVRPAEANRSAVEQAISPTALGAQAPRRRRKPTRRGCCYVEVNWQKPVRRIARLAVRLSAKGVGAGALAEENSARRADTRGGGFKVRTVRVSPRLSNQGVHAALRRGRPRRVEARWKASRRSSGCSARGSRGGSLGRPGQGDTGAARRSYRAASGRAWIRRGGARDGDEGRQRSVTCMAGLLQPTRRGWSVIRCVARRCPLDGYSGGLRSTGNRRRVRVSMRGSVEAGQCE
jgi:hypothetical protein